MPWINDAGETAKLISQDNNVVYQIGDAPPVEVPSYTFFSTFHDVPEPPAPAVAAEDPGAVTAGTRKGTSAT